MEVFSAPAAVQILSWPAYWGQIEDLGGGALQSLIGSSPHPVFCSFQPPRWVEYPILIFIYLGIEQVCSLVESIKAITKGLQGAYQNYI